VMAKYDIEARIKKRKYRYPGKTNQTCDNLLRKIDLEKHEIIFSDIFEFRLGDGGKIYCCFLIRRYTRQIIAFCYSYGMQADLVVETIDSIELLKLNHDLQIIFHSDQGKQYGAQMTLEKLMAYGFTRSMSRAGTPTDNAIAERFVGVFKLAVVDRYHYQTIGEFIKFTEKWLNFYNQIRPHEGLGMRSPNQFAEKNNLQIVSYLVVNSA
jgi:putative transposase